MTTADVLMLKDLIEEESYVYIIMGAYVGGWDSPEYNYYVESAKVINFNAHKDTVLVELDGEHFPRAIDFCEIFFDKDEAIENLKYM